MDYDMMGDNHIIAYGRRRALRHEEDRSDIYKGEAGLQQPLNQLTDVYSRDCNGISNSMWLVVYYP